MKVKAFSILTYPCCTLQPMAKGVFVSFILKLIIKGQFGYSISQDTSDLASHTTDTT